MLAYDGGQLVGFIMAAFAPEHENALYHSYLWRLNIGGEHQGKGYGRFAPRGGAAQPVIARHAGKDLIDEYRLFVNPIVLGGGTPYFPPLPKRLGLELIETRTFSQVVYLRYRR